MGSSARPAATAQDGGAFVPTPKQVETLELFRAQVGVLVAGDLVFLITALICFAQGYAQHREYPSLVFWLQLAIIAAGLLAAFPQLVPWLLAFMSGNRRGYSVGDRMNRTIHGIARAHTPIVFGLSFAVLFALTELVRETGLGIESPFIPMAVAPAVFGPFVARNPPTVAILLVLVTGALAWITWGDPPYACPHELCVQAQHPKTGVYFGVTVVFLVFAGGIAAKRLDNENDLEQQIDVLKEENVALREHLTTLDGRPADVPPQRGGPAASS